MDRPMMPGFICRLARKKIVSSTGRANWTCASSPLTGIAECLARFAVNKLGAELDGPLVKLVYVYDRRFDRVLRERLLELRSAEFARSRESCRTCSDNDNVSIHTPPLLAKI